jgi:hypothetical protein
MTSETLCWYAPCPVHRLWHDTASECLLLSGRAHCCRAAAGGSIMKCSRCGGEQDSETYGPVVLCRLCVLLIIREWFIRQHEFGESTAS